MKSRFCITLLGLFLAVHSAAPMRAEADDRPSTIRVMSFNIRFGSAKDGENHWDHRKEFVADTIKAFNADLVGTQETEAFQKDFLAEKLPEFTAFGAGRVDGKASGEMCALFYRTSRFKELDAGHFWLSETPQIPGSKSWDSSLPRMVSWVKLRDLKAEGEPELWFFNTHFDHIGKQARAESARLLHERVASLPKGARVIITGDFNSAEESPAYARLFQPENSTPLLSDAYRVKFPEKQPHEGTFNRFQPGPKDGGRIDWIAVSRQWKIDSFEVNRVEKNGRVPSDHFPLEAVLAY